MFGHRYFGARHFGPRYFGDGGNETPIPPVVVAAFSGGYGYVQRSRSVKEERERLGIIPARVEKIVKAVARATVEAEKTDTQAAAVLSQRLAVQEIEMQARYQAAMRLERDRLLQRDITRALAIQRRKKQLDDEEDEREVHMLLM